MVYEFTISLASGVQHKVQVTSDLEHAEILADVEEELASEKRPGWRVLGSCIVFSQAVSAVQVELF